VLLVNSPSNPLGATISAELAAELVALAERHGLWLLSDECYDQITFEGGVVSPMAVAPSPWVISVYSFSKVYAMTGWRVGYAVAPPAVAGVLARLQEPLISCVNAPAQMAALAALTGPQDVVAEMGDAYRERRDRALAVLEAAGVPTVVPGGAFYLWVDISASGRDSMTFARELIADHGVAVAPGIAFGPDGDGFVRVSLANELDAVVEGVAAVAAHVARLGSISVSC
jgi:aspartate aminotransferase